MDDDIDLDIDDVTEDLDEAPIGQVRHSIYDESLVRSVQDAKDNIYQHTSNEFIVECYLAATMLRNVCGDGDGFVAELATTIRSNLLVLATEISQDPAELAIQAARSKPDRIDQLRSLDISLTKIQRYRDHLEGDQ